MSTYSYGAVKQIVQQLTAETIFSMDMELDVWYKNGYHLLNTHVVANAPDGVTVLYVLVRNDP